LEDLGHPTGAWTFTKGGRDGAHSLASFEAALDVPDASTALAILRVYLRFSGLNNTGRWAISALPNWSGGTAVQRYSTVNGVGGELLYVEFGSKTGLVECWGVRLSSDSEDDLNSSDLVLRRDPKHEQVVVEGRSLTDLLLFFNDRANLTAVQSEALARTTKSSGKPHNEYLAEYLCAGSSSESTVGVHDKRGQRSIPAEIERRYTVSRSRRRLHQGPLRDLALTYYPISCFYCGIDVEKILDVAHLVPDSEGGSASVGNVRLLCANHHRAFDRGLMYWDSDKQQFGIVEGGIDIPPGPKRNYL